MSDNEGLRGIVRLLIVFVIVLVILYFVNQEGFNIIWGMINDFFSFISENPQFVVLLLLIAIILYLLRRREG